jgi:hypothetical protein
MQAQPLQCRHSMALMKVEWCSRLPPEGTHTHLRHILPHLTHTSLPHLTHTSYTHILFTRAIHITPPLPFKGGKRLYLFISSCTHILHTHLTLTCKTYYKHPPNTLQGGERALPLYLFLHTQSYTHILHTHLTQTCKTYYNPHPPIPFKGGKGLYWPRSSRWCRGACGAGPRAPGVAAGQSPKSRLAAQIWGWVPPSHGCLIACIAAAKKKVCP